jgi:hypothetical protein
MGAIALDRQSQTAAIRGCTFQQQHGFGHAAANLKESSGVTS